MFGFRFIKFQPGEYILRYRNGKVIREGAGLSFYYYAPTTSIVAVPMGSVDVPFIFEEVTADFQTVTVQGQVNYRITDQKKIAELLNFSLNMRGKGYISEDPQKLPQRVTNIVKILTRKALGDLNLREAIRATDTTAQNILKDIREYEEIQRLGLEILGVSILAILPNKETSRALEAQAREEILKKADEAIYVRRNASIEQERKVKENEFNTEIAVENKKKEVREAKIQAELAVNRKQNEVKEEQLRFDTELEEKKKEFVELSVENARTQADAKAYELTAMMKAFESMDTSVVQALANVGMQPSQLIAVAFQELAQKAGKIGQLNISPDLLQQMMKEQTV